jgi:hypothetical protein
MPQVMYERSHRIRATTGESLGQIFDPFFNRTWEHFCSHQHTPNHAEPSGFDCGVRHGNILYFAHPVFRHYRTYGAVANREFIARSIRSFLGESVSLSTNLPSTARVALTSQQEEKRHVLHVLYAPAIHRGGNIQLLGGERSDPRLVGIHRKWLAGVHDLDAWQSGSLPLGEGLRIGRVENHAVVHAACSSGKPCQKHHQTRENQSSRVSSFNGATR